ncbi:MAG: lytic transglycosylase domain-containing protein [Burkholderiales bacterium]
MIAVLRNICWIAAALLAASVAHAGNQNYELMSASVRASLSSAVSDAPVGNLSLFADADDRAWLNEMSKRLASRMPDAGQRIAFLNTVHYEALRAGLDTGLVLGLIEVESGFKKYAVSSTEARGYMQVMPFWVDQIGTPGQDLFHLRTNLRYGCNILRFYLDRENGDMNRALARYNGSLGKPDYPAMVANAWHKHWSYTPVSVAMHAETNKMAGN